MVADIELLQGKIVDDPTERIKGVAQLIEALAVELQKSQQTIIQPVIQSISISDAHPVIERVP